MQIDEQKQEVTLKVVYYGPALAGKTTNLLSLHDSLPAEERGDLVSLDTHQDRTLFFDLLPFFLVAPSGLRVKLKAYTVPGQVRYDATRKTILSGADGIVFVADSRRAQQRNNFESLANLEENCRFLGGALETLPLVVQFNKRDLPDVVSQQEVEESWSEAEVPIVFASAINGLGVSETFEQLCRLVHANCDEKLKLQQAHGLEESAFLKALGVTT